MPNKNVQISEEDDVSTHEASENSNIKSIDFDNESKQAKKSYIMNDFKEKLKKFIAIDDMIRNKKKEIKQFNDELKELKNLRQPYEAFIVEYLDKLNQTYVECGTETKLSIYESSKKAPLKSNFIKEAIIEQSRSNKLFDAEEKYNQFMESIMELMDKKRPVQKETKLKRTFKKTKNNKK